VCCRGLSFGFLHFDTTFVELTDTQLGLIEHLREEFFFFLISQNVLKSAKGAQPIVHRTYTRESLKRRR
jgi:hypothetical protein